MKKFESLSEFELIYGAYLYYLQRHIDELEFLEKHPSNERSVRDSKRLGKIRDELHDYLHSSEISHLR